MLCASSRLNSRRGLILSCFSYKHSQGYLQASQLNSTSPALSSLSREQTHPSPHTQQSLYPLRKDYLSGGALGCGDQRHSHKERSNAEARSCARGRRCKRTKRWGCCTHAKTLTRPLQLLPCFIGGLGSSYGRFEMAVTAVLPRSLFECLTMLNNLGSRGCGDGGEMREVCVAHHLTPATHDLR
jgi:hypothetical protein